MEPSNCPSTSKSSFPVNSPCNTTDRPRTVELVALIGMGVTTFVVCSLTGFSTGAAGGGFHTGLGGTSPPGGSFLPSSLSHHMVASTRSGGLRTSLSRSPHPAPYSTLPAPRYATKKFTRISGTLPVGARYLFASIDYFPADNGQYNTDVFDFLGRTRKQVGGENHEIGQFTRRDGPFLLLFERRIGAALRVGSQGLFHRQLFLGEPALRVFAVECGARDGGVQPEQRVEGSHGPICAKS